MREAVIHLDDAQLEAIGLAEVVAATREAGLRDVTELVCHGAGGVLLVEVSEPLPDAFGAFEAVEWVERIATPEEGVTYLCKVRSPDQHDELRLDENATAHEVSTVHEEGLELSIVGTQEEIRRSVAAVDDAGMNALLERLGDYEGSSSTFDSLTDRQLEVVETAYALGYYDVPRTAAAEDVAADLDLDQSTVVEHLQRAERNLVGSLLDRRG